MRRRDAPTGCLLEDLWYDATYYGDSAAGWAEYASRLAWEIGLYDDPSDAYGRPAHEQFTAARLVLDSAVNCGLWTYEEALALMRATMTDSETQLNSELLRYSTDHPAQAPGVSRRIPNDH